MVGRGVGRVLGRVLSVLVVRAKRRGDVICETEILQSFFPPKYFGRPAKAANDLDDDGRPRGRESVISKHA